MRKLATAVMALTVAAMPARADIFYHYAQITCLPDTHMFAVRTFGQYNTPRPPGHGIVTADELKDPPYTCDLPKADYSPALHIEIRGETSPPGNGYCQGEGYEAITITMNGKEIANVDMTMCPDTQRTITTIEGSSSYELLHCATIFGDAMNMARNMKETTCSGGEIDKNGDIKN